MNDKEYKEKYYLFFFINPLRKSTKMARRLVYQEDVSWDEDALLSSSKGDDAASPPPPTTTPCLFAFYTHLFEELQMEVRRRASPSAQSLLTLTCWREARHPRRFRGDRALHLLLEECRDMESAQYLLATRLLYKNPRLARPSLLHRCIVLDNIPLVRFLRQDTQPLRHHSCVKCAKLALLMDNSAMAVYMVPGLRALMSASFRTWSFMWRQGTLLTDDQVIAYCFEDLKHTWNYADFKRELCVRRTVVDEDGTVLVEDYDY